MHNGAVHDHRALPLRRPLLTAAALLALAACGGGGQEEDPAAGPTTSASTSASPEESVSAPSPTVSLTAEGTSLRLGMPATVAYEPRQGEEAVLEVTVSRLFSTTWERSFEGWKINRQQRSAQPYFVEGTVTNAGQADLGRRSLPLFAVGPGDVLVEATAFATRFAPCRPGAFPAAFAPGDRMSFCLVYLVPDGGELSGVAFQPTDDVEAITWQGKVRPLPRSTKGRAPVVRPTRRPSPSATTASPTETPTGSPTDSPAPSPT